MLESILSYIFMWLPALVAIAGIVTTVCGCLSKVKNAIQDLKSDNVVEEIRKDNEDIKCQVSTVLRENAALMKENRELKEKITGIRQKRG